MQTTIQIKLLPTVQQKRFLKATATEYVSLVNDIVEYALGQGRMPQLTSALVSAQLPSVLRNQSIRDARSVYKKCRKTHIHHVLHRLIIVWNNQNFKVEDGYISMPFLVDNRSQRLAIKADIPQTHLSLLTKHKLGTLRVSQKNGKWVAQIAVEQPCAAPVQSDVIMGVDLGLKCPAVACTSSGKVKFSGNGRRNKYVRRKFRSRRKKLGKSKKLNAIQRTNNKEQRWMKDQDHKVSREVVDFAIRNNVSEIRLEKLEGISKQTRTSRKNEMDLHTWSFYRTTHYIEYKAAMAGIKVVYVDPAYTSQRCPVCSSLHKMKDRTYRCSDCGYKGHRDLVGAINILQAPVTDGKSLSA